MGGSSKSVGWGIIGYGVIGPTHSGAIEAAPDAHLVAVCDVDASREQALRDRGIDAPFYTSAEEMLAEEPDIQVVSICTPSGLHHEAAQAAANAGRHVFSEKPLDISLENMDRMIDTCAAKGVKLGCVFQRRVSRQAVLARKALADSLIGKPILGESSQKYYRSPAYYTSAGWRGTWNLDGGGALMNQGVHGIDLLVYLMGDVDSVFAYADTFARKIEVEDTASATVRFKNGAIGSIVGTTSVVPSHRIATDIHGDLGTIHLDDKGITAATSTIVDGVHQIEEVDLASRYQVQGEQEEEGNVAADPTALSQSGHALLVQDMARAVIEDREPMIPGPEGRKGVELILAIYRSWKERKEISLPLR